MRAFHGLAVIFGLTLVLAGCNQQETATDSPVVPPDTTGKAIQIPGILQPPAGTSDWLKQAYQVQVLTPVNNTANLKADLAVVWTPEALLLHIHSNDVTPVETAVDIWNDSIEVFLASSPVSDDQVHFIFSPGRSSTPLNPLFKVIDKRKDAPKVVAPEITTTKSDAGYDSTISIPWANLKHIPQPREIIGLQVSVNDAQSDGKVSRRIWYSEPGADQHPELVQHVQLTQQADAPQSAAVWLQPKGVGEAVNISSSAANIGKKIEVWWSGKLIATGEMTADGTDGSVAEIPLTGDIAMQKEASLVVKMDGNVLPVVLKVPDLPKRRLEILKRVPLMADPSIFDTPIFPNIDFRYKELVEATFGSYTLHTRFFDANWNEVTVPKAPGRYGAVVEFHGKDNLSFTSYLTLYKTPHPYVPTKDPYSVTVKFPAAFGLPADIMAKEQWNVAESANWAFQDLSRNERGWAPVVAGLQDLTADPARWHGYNTGTIDEIWWTEMRKRLGENLDYPHLVQLPDGYDKDQKTWPLLLFLHGSGERGDDLDKVKNQGPLGYIHNGHSLPFIVVEPQCPLEQSWDPGRLNRLIDQVAGQYRVDPKRIYVTGLSMGGFGSIALAATSPDRIAAMASLSGGYNSEIASRLKKMPTWLFHGDADTVVPTRYSVDLAHAIQKEGAPVKLTIYPGVGHWGWDKTYADPAFYAWLLQQSK